MSGLLLGLWACFACTGFYVGKECSADGSVLLGRTVDLGELHVGHRVVVVPRVVNRPGRVYRGVGGFEWPLPATTWKYVATPRLTCEGAGEFASVGANERGLAIPATVTGYVRPEVGKAFPPIRSGCAEENLTSVIAASCATAAEAVDLVGAIMAKCGTSEHNVVMVADRREAWLVEIYTGRLWAAMRLPEDKVAAFGNNFLLGAYDPTSPDWKAAPDIIAAPQAKGLAVLTADGKLDLFHTFSGKRHQYANIRNWFAKRMFAPGTEGAYADEAEFPLVYAPARKLGVKDVFAAMRTRYEGTEWCPEETGREDVRVIGTEKQASSHVIALRDDLPDDRCITVWTCLGPAEHGVYLPLSNAITATDEDFARDQSASRGTFLPNLACDAFRRLAALCQTDRRLYGRGVRAFWAQREEELLARWPAVFARGDAAEATAFVLAEQGRALRDARQLHDELEWAIAANGLSQRAVNRFGVVTRLPERSPFVPSALRGTREAGLVLSSDGRSAAGDKLVLKLAADENWWGVGGGWGGDMPLAAKSAFAADLRVSNGGHPVMPLLVSDRGRYVWCDDPIAVAVTNGTMQIASDRGKIELKDGFGDLRGAFRAAAKAHFPASGAAPDPVFFSAPQLNTWVELTYNQNQRDILAYAEAMRANGVEPGVIMIDDTWQFDYGTWEFDPRRFADPKAMVEKLHADGYKVLLWTCPFVSMDSPGYRELADCDGLKGKGGFVMNGRGLPYPARWWNGCSALLDMTHPEGRAWFSRQLDRLQRDFGIDGFKLDGGGISHYVAADMVAYDKAAAPAFQSRAYGAFALKYPMSECRALFRLGGQPVVTRLADKSHNWRELARCVTDMLAVGICGYPFVCPDMIGGGSWIAFDPKLAPYPFDEELFVRSAQVHALCPMMQFSASPWRLLSERGQAAVRKAVETRQRFAGRFVKLAEESGRTGEPMMRYMEYQFPGCGYAAVKDQFMMGDFLLVAPQLMKGAPTRTVEIPEGSWTADDGTTVVGPKTVSVATPFDRIPHFVRRSSGL